MKTWVLWLIRIAVVIVGLLSAISPLTTALDSSTDLSTVSRVSRLLMGIGLFGIYVSVAIGFRNTWRQIGEAKWVGGRRQHRRATRQIDGEEPYGEHEIGYLRWLAERRVAAKRWFPLTLLQLISLIAFTTGFTLCPLTFAPTSGDHLGVMVRIAQGMQFLVQALRPVAALAALGCVALIVVTWRMRNDVKAKAFLERTQPVPWPTDGRR